MGPNGKNYHEIRGFLKCSNFEGWRQPAKRDVGAAGFDGEEN